MHPVPMRRTALDRLITDAGGQDLPDDNQMDQHLNDLLDELAGLIDDITFTRTTDGYVAEAHFQVEGPSITYDPAYTADSPDTDDMPFRTACLLHELMHVSVDRQYTHPPGPEGAYWRSYNLHYGVGAVYGFVAQTNTIMANLERIRTKATSEGALSQAVRRHIGRRLDYAVVTPHVHYDTVLLDLLVYLRLKGLAGSQTYRYISGLSQEARDRRTDSEGGPVPPAPAS